MVATTNPVLADLEAAIQAAETVLPTLLGIVGTFYAPANALTPFLPILQDVLTAVQDVSAALGQDIPTATQTVSTALSNLTPPTPTAVPAS